MLKKIILVVSLIALTLSSYYVSCKDKVETEEQQPNIVILFVDDLGVNDVGYNNPRFHTPEINQLAGESMNFVNAYVASPTCSPSRSTLLTGKHPARLRIVRHIPGGKRFGFDAEHRTQNEFHVLESDPAQMPSRNWLPLEELTYAEVLKEMGYKTGFVGKWHLGHEPFYPSYQGFDEEAGVSNLGHPQSYYPPYFQRVDKSLVKKKDGKYLTDYLTEEAVSFINKQNEEQPFVLQVSYYSVHTPHQGRKDLVERYEQDGWEGRYAHYGAMVTAVDESVGKIRQALSDKGISENTLLLFLSDQGGYFTNAPLRGGKTGGMALFEGGAKIPFLAHWPAKVQPGTCKEAIQTTDIFSTLIDAAGDLSTKVHSDGMSFYPLLENADNSLDREAIFLYRSYEERYASVLSDQWKMIAHRNGKRELFNLDNDPFEEEDISSKHSDKIEKLNHLLVDFENNMNLD